MPRPNSRESCSDNLDPLPARLSTHQTGEQTTFLRQLAEARWLRRVPATAIESILVGLHESLTSPSGERVRSLKNAFALLVEQASLLNFADSVGFGHGAEVRSNLAELSRSLSDAEISDALESLFDHPSTRLAVYGSLKPGESNYDQLSMVEGHWQDGKVKGRIKKPGEYLEFTWDVSSPEIPVNVLTAAELSNHFERLDQFEGPDYRRILVPVLIDETIQICHIYEGVRP